MRVSLEAMNSLGEIPSAPEATHVPAFADDAQERELRKAIEAASKPKHDRSQPQEIVARKVEVCTLSENEERDGYELRFPAGISPAMSNQLRLNGWRFTPRQWKDPIWYHRRDQAARKFGLAIVRLTAGISELKPVESGT